MLSINARCLWLVPVLVTLPPLGIIGLPSSLIVAGAILPVAGFVGLALVGISSYGAADGTVSQPAPRFVGIDMRLNHSLSADPDYIADYHSQSRMRFWLPVICGGAARPIFRIWCDCTSPPGQDFLMCPISRR